MNNDSDKRVTMKNYGFLYLLFILSILAIAFYFSREDLKQKSVHPTTNELAVEPDRMILNATHYLNEHLALTSLGYLTRTIEAMRLIEKDADPESNEMIEKAIADLQEIQWEIASKEIDNEHMNHVFTRALNSLTLVQLRVSKAYKQKGMLEEAGHALDYALSHLENVVQYSTGEERAIELRLISSIHDVMALGGVKNDQVVARLDPMIAELSTFVEQE